MLRQQDVNKKRHKINSSQKLKLQQEQRQQQQNTVTLTCQSAAFPRIRAKPWVRLLPTLQLGHQQSKKNQPTSIIQNDPKCINMLHVLSIVWTILAKYIQVYQVWPKASWLCHPFDHLAPRPGHGTSSARILALCCTATINMTMFSLMSWMSS